MGWGVPLAEGLVVLGDLITGVPRAQQRRAGVQVLQRVAGRKGERALVGGHAIGGVALWGGDGEAR